MNTELHKHPLPSIQLSPEQEQGWAEADQLTQLLPEPNRQAGVRIIYNAGAFWWQTRTRDYRIGETAEDARKSLDWIIAGQG